MTTHHFNNGTSLNVSLEQNNFITSSNNFIILESCAGSGKTQSIVLKNIFLLENNLYNPEQILTIVFGKHAQNDIINRISAKHYHIQFHVPVR